MTRAQLKQLEQDLWSAADNLHANSDLKATEYSTPVLGLIFLKFADINYRRYEDAIDAEFEQLEGSLPKEEYYRLMRTEETKHLPFDLLRQFDNIPDDATGDVFGQIYEYFLGKFALAEGQGGGEFFTPRSVVRLMVEIIEPHGGTVFDPACGSGGMFVQSADFIARHAGQLEAQGKDTSVFVYGQEKRAETVKLARMNLAVNGLRGEIRQAITYYERRLQVLRQVRLRAGQSALQRRRRLPVRGGEGPPLQHLRRAAQEDQGQEVRAGQGDRPQRQLPVDQSVRHLTEGAG